MKEYLIKCPFQLKCGVVVLCRHKPPDIFNLESSFLTQEEVMNFLSGPWPSPGAAWEIKGSHTHLPFISCTAAAMKLLGAELNPVH